MIDANVKQLLRNLDERLTLVEQFLPTLATKADLAPLATKAEIAELATKAEIAQLATKAELAQLATKAELHAVAAAAKADLAAAVAQLATKAELLAVAATAKADLAAAVAPLATKAELREEGEKTRRHMDVVAEHITAQMAMLYESHTRHTERLDGHETRIQAAEAGQGDLDLRIGALEHKSRRSR